MWDAKNALFLSWLRKIKEVDRERERESLETKYWRKFKKKKNRRGCGGQASTKVGKERWRGKRLSQDKKETFYTHAHPCFSYLPPPSYLTQTFGFHFFTFPIPFALDAPICCFRAFSLQLYLIFNLKHVFLIQKF